MKKLSITYRATIDPRVPIVIKKPQSKKAMPRARFVVFRERLRLSF